MNTEITIQEGAIETAVEVNSRIVEFESSYDQQYFENRYLGREKLILVAYCCNQAAGYLVAYDKDEDKSFYCWMAGVDPVFRKMGVLTELMKYLFVWAREHGYQKIKIKTRNKRREMLAFLVKNGFYFIELEEMPKIEDHRVLLEKSIE